MESPIMLRSINPSNDVLIAATPVMSADELDHHLGRAKRTSVEWILLPFHERALRVRELARLLRIHAEEAALLLCAEMGKPLTQARAELGKCAATCEYYAAEAASMLAPTPLHLEFRSARIVYEPLGVLLAIMPWNFPYWQTIRAVIPAIMAGNTVVVKPAPEITLSAALLQGLFDSAGLGDGIVTTLRATVEQTHRCIADKRIACVTFTGSTRAGREVAALAGRALKKTVLELGGSDAVCVCEDADIALAARIAAQSRLVNNGQSCIAAKRCIVMRRAIPEFERALKQEMMQAVMGDPREETTTVGPLARRDLCDALNAQVRESVRLGARVVLDGGPTGDACFFAPMILGDVTSSMPVYGEEVFGPVMAVIAADTEAEMIRIANDTRYGLGATVISADVQRAHRIAERLDAGVVFINDMVRSDARLPFGGCKDSGWGRELGALGIREFVNIKTVVEP